MGEQEMRRTLSAIALVCLLAACVTGGPELTPEQDAKLAGLKVYPPGESPKERFTPMGDVSAADCSGAPAGGRVWGNAEKAIETLKKKAVAQGADAVIQVHCAAAPFLNNCWAAQKCTGQAVRFQ
jgi:hypothetical protein